MNTEFVAPESRGSYLHGSTPVALHPSWNRLSFLAEMTDGMLPETLNDFGLVFAETVSGETAVVAVGRRAARAIQDAARRADIRVVVSAEAVFSVDSFVSGRLRVTGEMSPTRAAIRGFVAGSEAPEGLHVVEVEDGDGEEGSETT